MVCVRGFFILVAGIHIASCVPGVMTPASTNGLAENSVFPKVESLMREKCWGCHSPSGVSFPMQDHSVIKGLAPALVLAVEARRMPPWLAAPGHQEYRDDLSLTDEAIDVMRQWRDQGFPVPESGSSNFGTLVSTSEASPQITYDLTLPLFSSAEQRYLPRQDRKDDYRCFILPWPKDKATFVTGFRAAPGNRRVAHHLVAFSAHPDIVANLKKLDEEEPGLGYQCFGGGIPDRLGDPKVQKALESREKGLVKKIQDGTTWLAHWAPGMNGYAFPEGTGIPIEPGAAVIVQMHYYSGTPSVTDFF